MKKISLKIIFLIFLSISLLRKASGIPYDSSLSEPDPAFLKYEYVDIYKPFFKKVHRGNEYIYVPQRLRHNSKEFPLAKAPNTIRIFILGGSVANAFDSAYFEKILKDFTPNSKFEIINCAMCAYDSFRTHLITEEILNYKPDLIIVISGNNEYYKKVKIDLGVYYLNKFLRKWSSFRTLEDWFRSWSYGRRFIYPINIKKRFVSYERNIRDIVKKAKFKGVPIILCTLPVNFRDCPPGGESPLDKQFLLGQFFLYNKDYFNAISAFERFLEANPSNPFGYYFLARTYDMMANYEKAKKYYLEALKLDFYGRATPDINKIIRQICLEEEVGLAEVELMFLSIAKHGLLGLEQFHDHCHFYKEYYAVVEEVISGEIFQNDKIYSCLFSSNRFKFKNFSFYQDFPSLKERGQMESYSESIVITAIVEAITNPCVSERAILYFEKVYEMDPDLLWGIRFSKQKFKTFFLDNFWTSDISDSNFEAAWTNILYIIRESYRRLGLYTEALGYFNTVMALDETFYLPYLGRALIYYVMGERLKAQKDIEKAKEISGSQEVEYYREILGL